MSEQDELPSLLSISVFFSGDKTLGAEYFMQNRMRRALEREFKDDPLVKMGDCCSHDFGTEGVNARKCGECGRWATDMNEPDEIDALCSGWVADGTFLCSECAPGELIRPDAGDGVPK